MLAGLAGLAVAGPAHAATPFSPPVQLSSPSSHMGDARMNARGDAAVVWQGSRNLNADPDAGKVEATVAPAGRGFAPVQRLASGRVRNPQVALGADGRLAATWGAADFRQLPLALGTVAGGFGPAEVHATENATRTIGSGGHAVALWTSRSPERDTVTQLRVAYRAPGGGFGPMRVIAEHAYVDSLEAVIDPTGVAIVAWRAQSVADALPQIWTATISPAGEPSPPFTVSPEGERAGGVRLAANDRGDVAAHWSGAPPSVSDPWGLGDSPRVAVRPAGGSWQPAEALAENRAITDVSLDRGGGVVAVWGTYSRAGPALRVRRRPPGGPFGPAQDIVAPGLIDGYYRAGVDGRGNLVVVWSETRDRSSFDPILFAATQRPGQRLSLPTTLREHASPEALVFDAGERGLLIARDWQAESVLGYEYLGSRLAVPAPAPLARLALDARRRSIRFRVTEPGRVVATIERAVPRRGYRRVSRRTWQVRRGRLSLALRGPRGRGLRRGAYRLILEAHDLTGRRLALRRLRFRIAA